MCEWQTSHAIPRHQHRKYARQLRSLMAGSGAIPADLRVAVRQSSLVQPIKGNSPIRHISIRNNRLISHHRICKNFSKKSDHSSSFSPCPSASSLFSIRVSTMSLNRAIAAPVEMLPWLILAHRPILRACRIWMSMLPGYFSTRASHSVQDSGSWQ
jgi:hypothetical protein